MVHFMVQAIANKSVCDEHGEILMAACRKCDKLICFACDINIRDCVGQCY